MSQGEMILYSGPAGGFALIDDPTARDECGTFDEALFLYCPRASSEAR